MDSRAIEAARHARQRASWEQMKAAVAAKYEGTDRTIRHEEESR